MAIDGDGALALPQGDDPLRIPEGAADQAYVWLSTIGRRSGLKRTVELWFGLEGSTLYFLAGGGQSAGWVQNSLAAPDGVRVRLAGATYRGRARAVEPGTDEDNAARRLLAAKYQGWSEGRPLSGWARNSFCLAIDLNGAATDSAATDRPTYR